MPGAEFGAGPGMAGCAAVVDCVYWVAPTGSEVRNILDLVGLSDVIPTFDTIEHAPVTDGLVAD